MTGWENPQFQQPVSNCALGNFGAAPVLRSTGYCAVSHHFLLPFASNERSVAAGCFVPPTCAVGFTRILCNLLFVVIIACGFFFLFFPVDFFALWLLSFYVGMQKDPTIILAR